MSKKSVPCNSAKASTRRSTREIEKLINNAQQIWNQANINFDVSIQETVLTQELIDAIAVGDFRKLYLSSQFDIQALNIFYINDLLGPNGLALSPNIALVADRTSVNDFRATSHEIGHLLGLSHTTDSSSRLLFSGTNGTDLSSEEIAIARTRAILLE